MEAKLTVFRDEVNVSVQLGLGVIPIDQGHRQDSHAPVSGLPCPRGRHAEMAPRGSGCILLGCAPLPI